MEKYGEIKEGITPPELKIKEDVTALNKSGESRNLTLNDLAEHVTKRTADAAAISIQNNNP